MAATKKPAKDTNFLFLIVGLVALIVAISFVAGTVFNISKARDKQEDNTLATKDNKLTLPKEFPDNFPIHPEMELVNSYIERGKSATSMSVFWKTDKGLNELIDFYKTSLINNKWNITREFEEGDSYTFTISNANTDGFVGITKEDERLTVSATLAINP